MTVKYITNINQLPYLSDEEKKRLRPITEKFPFRANDYYLKLINWDDPHDPIRRIIIPCEEEGEKWGKLDASNEAKYTVAPGLEHKYPDTALFLVSKVCGSFCRFCFRKRLFMHIKDEVIKDYTPAIEYIQNHPEITNVLVTGGEPLLLTTQKLERLIKGLREIEHVGIIRIGTKIPVFNPYRILEDPALLEMIHKYSLPHKRIYVVLQINHPREMTEQSIEVFSRLKDAGAVLMNQTPIIRGINDNPEVLAELFRKLSFMGIAPYYVFQGRPTLGNKPFAVSIMDTYRIFEEAKMRVSGLAKRARYVMSHATGKIEILAIIDDKVFLRYHRAADPFNMGRVVVAQIDPTCYWFDDLKPVEPDFTYKPESDLKTELLGSP